jgi:hypothetical protein
MRRGVYVTREDSETWHLGRHDHDAPAHALFLFDLSVNVWAGCGTSCRAAVMRQSDVSEDSQRDRDVRCGNQSAA